MNYEVVITADADESLRNHLLQHFSDGLAQEDLCFALWKPSTGLTRYSAIVDQVLLPEKGERLLHGNTSFTPEYLGRVAWTACQQGTGLAFLHSHPSTGWQGMSPQDIEAEGNVIAYTAMSTGLPLIGLTAGMDGYWSARFWIRDGKSFRRKWCPKVRIVGKQRYDIHFDDNTLPPPPRKNILKRTYDTWGTDAQNTIARINVGIVGLGSVGSVVAEMMARIGVTKLTLIDPDRIEEHNLDRLLHASTKDIGSRKVDLAYRSVKRSATAKRMDVTISPLSIHNRIAYQKILDCDLIFSCVDRPIARDVLNFVAHSHLIPVIDGGVAIETDLKTDRLFSAHWRAHLISPFHQCMRCNGQYNTSMVVMELDGSLDDPNYVTNIAPTDGPAAHNVFPFSVAVAAMETNLMLRYLLARDWWPNVQQLDYQFVTAEIRHVLNSCSPGCSFPSRRGQGDAESPQYLIDPTEQPLWSRFSTHISNLFKVIGKRSSSS